ncbi:VOC family protein [Paenibacillus sp. OV219]|uniref:VOC family protein n=1 Tax=Paenibacillus sp. OV219 TaxID=1884377 RepID=UPI0008C80EB3|nr:VOC family protein [Paenibacillus sp. OV219]SEM89291.1 Catechol 2,3-dioxygenase [Paenibacillus sp. OV219]
MEWQGIHHIALTTKDLEETIRFYSEMLGMQSSPIFPANPFHGRHAFIHPGAPATALGLHFFEVADAQIHTHPEALQRLTFIPGAMQHIAFALQDEAAGLLMRNQLESRQIEMTALLSNGPTRSFGFLDNNGIQLEAIWPKPPQ